MKNNFHRHKCGIIRNHILPRRRFRFRLDQNSSVDISRIQNNPSTLLSPSERRCYGQDSKSNIRKCGPCVWGFWNIGRKGKRWHCVIRSSKLNSFTYRDPPSHIMPIFSSIGGFENLRIEHNLKTYNPLKKEEKQAS